MTDDHVVAVSCRLEHHGAAASSTRQAIAWIPNVRGEKFSFEEDINNNNNNKENDSSRHSADDTSSDCLVYASHAILNVAERRCVCLTQDNCESAVEEENSVWQVRETLRSTAAVASSAAVPHPICPVITTVDTLQHHPSYGIACDTIGIVCGFSNGTINLWIKNRGPSDEKHAATVSSSSWHEVVLVHATTTSRSITTLRGIWLDSWNDKKDSDAATGCEDQDSYQECLLLAGSSAGATMYHCHIATTAAATTTASSPRTVLSYTARILSATRLLESPVSSVRLQHVVQPKHPEGGATTTTTTTTSTASSSILAFVGTASPRHNKIHVHHVAYEYHVNTNDDNNHGTIHRHYAGALSGHEDWISCMDWCDNNNNNNATSSALLASGSQDAKIRLWMLRTSLQRTPEETTITATKLVDDDDTGARIDMETTASVDDADSGTGDDLDDEKEEEEEGESRLEIVLGHQGTGTTATRRVMSVTLEALLLGHEDAVTSVTWHPNPSRLYGLDDNDNLLLLISSSMDRSILLWAPTAQGQGIWVPITRVGSAGGILGGSVGSSLLGYCHATVDPRSGRHLLGHAYGGSIHVWTLMDDQRRQQRTHQNDDNDASCSIEERAALVQWKATPCITGHFAGVTDLCWEATCGEYLLTVSSDQTCRLWAPVRALDNNNKKKTSTVVANDSSTAVGDNSTSVDEDVCWMELARPQVHGYNLTAVTSVSTLRHLHLMVSGADEKEVRVFDAPASTIRILQATSNGVKHHPTSNAVTDVDRVERAYIPSLGLSNKASAVDAVEEVDAPEEEMVSELNGASAPMEKKRLPLERDLGAVSLWPEVRKLFGHNTELYCLASSNLDDDGDNVVLVASSCKARDVDAAAIRLWNVHHEGSNPCVQVLSGGHKSTVATLAFSRHGHYLASSGKDRRLCLWKRRQHDIGAAAAARGSSDAVVSSFPMYDLAWAKNSAHKRIVWSVDFCYPYSDADDDNRKAALLASGSRDGCVKLWRIVDLSLEGQDETAIGLDGRDAVSVSEVYSFAPSFTVSGKPDAVTALSFAPIALDTAGDAGRKRQVGLLALGLESGRIEVWQVPLVVGRLGKTDNDDSAPKLLLQLEESYCHIATVTKLAWRPTSRQTPQQRDTKPTLSCVKLQLASSSADCGCRIYELRFCI